MPRVPRPPCKDCRACILLLLTHSSSRLPPPQYLVANDFPDYLAAQEEVDKAYRDKKRWAKMR